MGADRAQKQLAYWNITTHDDTGPTFRVASVNPEQLARLQAATTDLTPTQLPGFLAISGACSTSSLLRLHDASARRRNAGYNYYLRLANCNARRVAEALRDDLLAAKLNLSW